MRASGSRSTQRGARATSTTRSRSSSSFPAESPPKGSAGHLADVDAALGAVIRSEHNSLARIWELATRNERLVLLALSAEPLNIYAESTRERFGLPAATFVQRAVRALVRDDVVEKEP